MDKGTPVFAFAILLLAVASSLSAQGHKVPNTTRGDLPSFVEPEGNLFTTCSENVWLRADASNLLACGPVSWLAAGECTGANGGCLTVNASGQVVCSDDDGGAGGGAPTDAEYVTTAAHAGLSAERVLGAGANTTVTTGAGTVQVDVSGVLPDARIGQSSVTQHQAALSITESQVSDLAHTTDTTCSSAACAVGTDDTVTLVSSAAPAPTVEGRLEWDTDDDRIVVGDAVGQKVFHSGAHTVDTDDQTAVEVPYTPTTATDWVDPDPADAGDALDDLAGRLTAEEAKADDDVPEAADYTNLTAGRSLTKPTEGTLDADPELYERTSCINVDPAHSTTDWLFLRAERALTVTGIDCIVDAATSVVLTLQECSADGGSCAATEAAMTCGTTNTTEAAGIDDAAVDAGDWLRVLRGTVTGSPTQAILCVTYELGDA